MDYQMKEVDRYRTAMRKMATDLLHVREDCKRLEDANSRLRRELGQHDEISRLMVSSKDLDNVTHSELVQKFGEIIVMQPVDQQCLFWTVKLMILLKTMKRNTLKNDLLSICFLSVFCILSTNKRL